MMTGDYIKHNGKVVKVTQDNCYDIVDIENHTMNNICVQAPNIMLDADILLACGLTQDHEHKNRFNWSIQNESLMISGEVLFDLSPLKQICNLIFTLATATMKISKSIMVLSELQDFIRINTGLELPIDFKRLTEVVK